MNLHAITLVAAFLAGLLLGAAYFWLLFRHTRLYAAAGASRKAALVYYARFPMAAALLALIAQAGAGALLSAFIGVLVARTVVLAKVRHG